MAHISKTLGIAPQFGGFHKTRGTKNALLNLGEKTYLELLAIDENNSSVPIPRWMGIDLIAAPKITRWAIKSNDLKSDATILKGMVPELGAMERGQRMTEDNKVLQWKLTRPLPSPEVELLPFFIEWGSAETHPTALLNEECSLDSFYATHPRPRLIKDKLEKLGVRLKIKESDTIGFHAVIKGPKGCLSI